MPDLFLLAPVGIENYLKSFHKYFEEIDSLYTLVPNSVFNQTNPRKLESRRENLPKSQTILEHLNIKELKTCLVPHCYDAFGVSFVLNDGFKFTYSGDTMPSKQLETIGKNYLLY